MKRITKNFKKKSILRFGNEINLEDYYLLSLAIRKELISDIFEYECLIANKLIEDLEVFSMTLTTVKKYYENMDYIYEEIEVDNSSERKTEIEEELGLKPNTIKSIDEAVKKGSLKKFIDTFETIYMKGRNVKLRIHFENLTFGSKVNLMKTLRDDKVKDSLNTFFYNNDSYYNHFKEKKDDMDFYLFPTLEFICDVRNSLCHRDLELDSDVLLLNAYTKNNRKHRFNKIIKMFSDQLMIFHDKRFYLRMIEKIENNHKLNKTELKEIVEKYWSKI